MDVSEEYDAPVNGGDGAPAAGPPDEATASLTSPRPVVDAKAPVSAADDAPVTVELMMLKCLVPNCNTLFRHGGDKGSLPFVLSPCGHVVCGGCAEAAQASGKCVFGHCNVAVAVPELPDRGLAALALAIAQDASSALQHTSGSETESVPQRPPCADCTDIGQAGDAVLYCESCEEYYCDSHSPFHKRKHTTRVISSAVARRPPLSHGSTRFDAVTSSAPSHVSCPVHPDCPLSLFCIVCKLSVCQQCVDLFHQSHTTTASGSSVDFVRRQLFNLRSSFLVALGTLQKHCAAVAEVTAQLLENSDRALSDIDAMEAALIAAVESHCKALRREVSECVDGSEGRVKRLTAQSDGLWINAWQCEAIIEVTEAALAGSDPVSLADAAKCCKDALGLTEDKYVRPHASPFLEVSAASGEVVTDALSNILRLRKV